MKNIRVIVVTGAALVAATPAVAQSPHRFQVAPRAGIYAPLNAIGPAARAGGPWFLDLDRADPAPSLDISAEAGWPGAHYRTRISALVTLPAKVTGEFHCFGDAVCPAVFIAADAEVSVMAFAGDLVYFPMRLDRAIRPYSILGGGIKRYEFSWAEPATLLDPSSETETTLALHAGVGLDIDVFGTAFRLEVADYWSPEGSRLDSGSAASPAVRRRAQHDLDIALGWQLLRF
jgi:hypothetical protein